MKVLGGTSSPQHSADEGETRVAVGDLDVDVVQAHAATATGDLTHGGGNQLLLKRVLDVAPAPSL